MSDDIDEEIKKLHSLGDSDKTIAYKMGYCQKSIMIRRRRAGIPANAPTPIREFRTMEINVIRMFADGMSDNEISKMLHVSIDLVYSIRKRRGLHREIDASIDIDGEVSPSDDPESLYCSPILGDIIGKDIKRMR